jgi:hypothetical protein
LQDEIAGEITGTSTQKCFKYVHPVYSRHVCRMLDGVKKVPRVVEEYEIYQVDRRVF